MPSRLAAPLCMLLIAVPLASALPPSGGAVVLEGTITSTNSCVPVGSSVSVRGAGVDGLEWVFGVEIYFCAAGPQQVPFAGPWQSQGGGCVLLQPDEGGMMCLSDPRVTGLTITYDVMFCEIKPTGCKPIAGGVVSGPFVAA